MDNKPVRTIMCCCGAGVGTSLLIQMAVEDILSGLDLPDVVVKHGTFQDAGQADLVVTTRTLQKYAEKFADKLPPVLLMDDLRDTAELTRKLGAALNF